MLITSSPTFSLSWPRRALQRITVSAVVLGAAGLVVATPAAADGPTTFTNGAPITITTDTPAPPTPATPYPSTITVSGMAGPVSDVDVRLNGFSHGFANDVDLLVVGPSGANLVLLSDPGGPNGFVGANNATVTFDDSAAAGVPQTGTISGSVSYRPTDTDAGETGADTFPAPAPAPGAATTLGSFTGTNPNGTWSLYVVDDATGDAGSIAGGWSVTITTSVVAAATTTAVSSSPNPSTTGTSVTFTASVTSGAVPVTTGTVTFTEGPTTLAANVPFNATGQATFSTSALTEGSHTVTATYSGTATLLTSSATVTHVVDNATTTPDGDTWCNSGGIAVPSAGPGTPYPSHITVSGAGSAISLLTVDLADVAHTAPFDLEVLLVGPSGQNVVLMSDVGGFTPAVGVDLSFADSAAGLIPAAGPLAAGAFDPSDDDSDGADALLPAPAPAVSSATTLATFNGTNPNGIWSLFVVDDASGDSGSVAGGWCLNVSTSTIDQTPPTFPTPPANVTASATGPGGATVTFPTPIATDNVDPAPVVVCAPASGTTFPIGTTTVTCTATDQAGNTATTSFTVTVGTSAVQLLSELEAKTAGMAPADSLRRIAREARRALEAGNTAEACRHLSSFLVTVNALRIGGRLSAAKAAQFTADATQIRAVIGCP